MNSHELKNAEIYYVTQLYQYTLRNIVEPGVARRVVTRMCRNPRQYGDVVRYYRALSRYDRKPDSDEIL